jgi:hypothetical protein
LLLKNREGLSLFFMEEKRKMELLNTPKAVNTYGGKSQRQATRIASRLSNEGYPYPQKVGRDWIAPAEVWEYVLGRVEEYPRDIQFFDLLNTREAAEKNNRSADWAKDLARRHSKNQIWPQKVGREWIAPAEVWRELFQNTLPRGKYSNKKKN